MMSNSEPFSYWLHAQCISFLPLLVEKGSLAAPMACHLVAQVQALLQYMTQRHQHAHIYSKDNFHQCVPTIFLCKFRSQTSHPYRHQCLDHSRPCGNHLLLPVSEQLCATVVNGTIGFLNGLQPWNLMPRLRPKGIQLLTSWSSFTRLCNSAAVQRQGWKISYKFSVHIMLFTQAVHLPITRLVHCDVSLPAELDTTHR